MKKKEFLIEPTRVVTRQSTEWTAISDQRVARALSFIRLNVTNPQLCVSDVSRAVGLSRRATEIRFRNTTGRTVREEIEHVRLERLKALLVETDQRISDLVTTCGFRCQTHLGRIFRKRFGMTMTQFRATAKEQS